MSPKREKDKKREKVLREMDFQPPTPPSKEDEENEERLTTVAVVAAAVAAAGPVLKEIYKLTNFDRKYRVEFYRSRILSSYSRIERISDEDILVQVTEINEFHPLTFQADILNFPSAKIDGEHILRLKGINANFEDVSPV